MHSIWIPNCPWGWGGGEGRGLVVGRVRISRSAPVSSSRCWTDPVRRVQVFVYLDRREEQRLRMFESTVLGNIFTHKRSETAGVGIIKSLVICTSCWISLGWSNYWRWDAEDGKCIKDSGRESCLRSSGRQRRGRDDLEGCWLDLSGYV